MSGSGRPHVAPRSVILPPSRLCSPQRHTFPPLQPAATHQSSIKPAKHRRPDPTHPTSSFSLNLAYQESTFTSTAILPKVCYSLPMACSRIHRQSVRRSVQMIANISCGSHVLTLIHLHLRNLQKDRFRSQALRGLPSHGLLFPRMPEGRLEVSQAYMRRLGANQRPRYAEVTLRRRRAPQALAGQAL